MANNRFQKFQQEFGIIGHSEAIREVFEVIEQVAITDISVLIIGESGTGKELVAKAIHKRSLRANAPLVIVNAGAIPEGIIESELFGHEKGAFTGAIAPKKGFFETANGGTIFLDEIGEMPLSAQVKILRVLEGREFTRVGGAGSNKVNVRIIAATNRELEYEVKAGNFRQDLYFRLRAVNIKLPPLRDRKSDIMLIANKIAADFCTANHITFEGFDDSAIPLLEDYPWPGNVRELKNLVESMIVLEKGGIIDQFVIAKHLKYSHGDHRALPVPLNKTTEQAEREFIYRALIDLKAEISEMKELLIGRVVQPRQLRPWGEIRPIAYAPEPAEVMIDDSQPTETPNFQTMQEMERFMIENALRRSGGNKRKAAKLLKISERTLYRKIKEYELPY
ncbi:sigma-54-dependent Fis family transcriptional regulator [candidate division KSB1 bacterium]|nr:sigma-54-dependent Fis family transcriptional regulator [candidate division KSB1 bacterium]